MKVNEILNEQYYGYTGRLKDFGSVKRGWVDEAIPSAIIEPQLRNTDTYMQMRYGMALAAAAALEGKDDPEWEQESAWAENIGMIGYTDAEVERIHAADKLMGVQSLQISKRGSQERTDVNIKSPVADTSWKKYKK